MQSSFVPILNKNRNIKSKVMRKSIKILKSIIVLLAVISLTQCDEDETTPKTINTIKMNGVDFPIVSASMMGVSMDDFGSTVITFASGTGTQAKSLSIDVESYTQATIEGEYAYPEVTGKKLLDDWLTDYSIYVESSLYTSNLETGQVTITHNSGNNYTVEINLEMVDGVTFIGKYTGNFYVMFNNQ